MQLNIRGVTFGVALCLAVGVTSSPVSAQQAEQARGQVIEEVLVMARRREETLQTVPVAVTAFTGEQLESQNIFTPMDLGRSVPGLSSLGSPSAASIVTFTLRGQTAGDVLSTVDPAVSIYVDGVNIPRPRGLNASFFDLERVEVLKGPQGTLYGRNTTGGAINVISRSPDYDGVHGYVSGRGGRYNDWRVGGAVNVPLIDNTMAARLAYQRWSRDGFGDNSVTGQELGGHRDQHFFRGSLLIDPTDNINVMLKGEWTRLRENGNLNPTRFIYPLGDPGNFAAFQAAIETGALDFAGLGRIFTGAGTADDFAALAAGQAALEEFATLGDEDFNTAYYEHPQRDWFEGYTFGTTITIDLSDDLQLRSITGYREFKNRQLFDLDGTPFRVLSVGLGHFPEDGPILVGAEGAPVAPFQFDPGPEQDAEFFSQEFTLSGLGWDGRLNWLGGVYFSTEEGSDVQHAQAFPALLPSTFVHDGAKIENVSWSIFSQNDFAFTDTLGVTLGARYTEERRSLTSHSRNFFFLTNEITCITGVEGTFASDNKEACETKQEETFTGWSWLASLNWQARDDMLVYLKAARGFRGGAFQLRSPTLAPAGPETAQDIEIGLKSDFFGRRLRVNMAAYETDYSNKQESVIVTRDDGGSATVIQNAADATIRGFEMEVFALPFEGLTLGGTLGYIWGEYDSFPGALPIDAATPVDASGERFAYPPWEYSLNARYEFPMPGGQLGLQADWAWRDGARPPDRLIDGLLPEQLVNSFVAQCNGGVCGNGKASLGLLNARIDYEILDWDTTVSFWVTNALDKTYQFTGVAASNLGGVQTGLTGEPRMWGLTLRKDFGGF